MAILLDCTFRDGGYQTGWRFDDAFLAAYLAVAESLDLGIIEIGYMRFRTPHRPGAGDFAGLPESLTAQQSALLRRVERPQLAVMVDAGDLPDTETSVHAATIMGRIESSGVPISVIRIATRLPHLARTVAYARAFAQHGVRVIVNLMQAADLSARDLGRELPTVIGDTPLAAFYVADSFGRMTPADVSVLVGTLAKALPVPLGFHAHDNCGLAVANATAASAAGARYLDATMGGLGRGAGNARTESLRLVTGSPPAEAALVGLELFLAEQVEPLHARANWGASALYRRQARTGLHPTYAQRIAEDVQLDEAARLALLARLAQTGQPGRFDADALAEARRAISGEAA